ncbi:excinuclease ABC subunit UvrA [Fundicoccus culcitae]|uniref:UvrABC system protein A n=1 Tax=Fundicoccus culcitae TaxID=2969821 RepID=A0ABY5P2T1_9LACT|nr:excinuclease ABC subunit UvrA [Fundicoccus culcitae]UUX32763.1 excinuclease ABC subunit UvrA [Fundicoccus culcitae]
MITLRDVSVNNLKNLSIDIPQNKVVVFTGVSGSGKSSLVMDTIGVEGQRAMNKTYPLYLQNLMPQYEPANVGEITHLTPVIMMGQESLSRNSRSTVGTITELASMFRLLFSRMGQPSAGPSSAYSFNHPMGMCPECSGLGNKMALDIDRIIDWDLTLNEGAITFTPFSKRNWQWKIYANSGKFDLDKPLKDYSPEEKELLLYGKGFKVEVAKEGSYYTGSGVDYEGIVDRFNRLYLHRNQAKLSKSVRKEVEEAVSSQKCPVCHGKRLNEAALSSLINEKNIADYFDMDGETLIAEVETIEGTLVKGLLKEIKAILQRIIDLGMGYLHLGRNSDTLSGGELQRLKLIQQLGSNLSGLTYIFDEPTRSLHAKDVQNIQQHLFQLRDKGNTVLVVEHNLQMIQDADWIIELGPAAGEQGGEIIFEGTFDALLNQDTPTSRAFKQKVTLNGGAKEAETLLTVESQPVHNLKAFKVHIPANALTALVGVSGSGKSTFIKEIVMQQYPDFNYIDQQPIGSNSRSTIATYTGVMDSIRDIYSKVNKVKKGWFSSNAEGACPHCQGKGVIQPDMAFADKVTMVCDSCHGTRYREEVLQYSFKGYTIVDVLKMTANEAMRLFADYPAIEGRLQLLMDTGMGYLRLGQSTDQLSGGERQRLKLASQLNSRASVFILDEPSAGLHISDLEQLMKLFNKMLSQGHTLILIEHQLQIIAQADWIIELGPGGGNQGGELVFMGTPVEMLDFSASPTGSCLKNYVGIQIEEGQ